MYDRRVCYSVTMNYVYTAMAKLSALALALALFASCQALTGETLGRNIDDATLTTWVKSKLAADKAVNLTRVQVTTHDGVVQLTGTVDSLEWRDRAEQIARQVDGVKGVVNNIQVKR